MPAPSSVTRRLGLTRRAMVVSLSVALGSGLVGCTPDRQPDEPDDRARGGDAEGEDQADPDVTVAALALADETRVLGAVEATSARHRRLAGLLRPVADSHGAHVDLLADAAPDETPATGSTGSPSASAEPKGPVRVPRDERAALQRLAGLEQELTTSSKRHAFAAQSGAFARLLASMAASSAQHARVLAEASREGPDRR